MPNSQGRYTREEAYETGLPIYITTTKRWTETPYPFAVLLSKSRCKKLGVPILSNGHEKPSAFLYAPNAGIGTGDLQHRYIPLYDRTDAVDEIGLNNLFDREIMGGKADA